MATNEETNAAGTNGPTPHPMVTDPPPTGSTIVPAPRKKLDSEIGRTLQQPNEDLFDDTNAFVPLRTSPFMTPNVRFHKLVNDMKITQLEIPTLQMNTKFVHNLQPNGVMQFQRKAPVNVGKDRLLEGKKVDMLQLNREKDMLLGSVKNPIKDGLSDFKDKALLLKAKEKGDVLDAEAEHSSRCGMAPHLISTSALLQQPCFTANHEMHMTQTG
ncbi:hypothetical protein Tco_0994316 [Tanacetum coccineum]